MKNWSRQAIEATVVVAIIVLILIGGLLTYAQNNTNEPETTTTGTGSVNSVLERAVQLEWDARVVRSQNFREALLASKTKVAALQKEINENRTLRDKNRATCRTDLRAANDSTRLTVALRCYRAELSLLIEQLRKEREWVDALPGVTEDVRWLTHSRMDLLKDAATAIITAIDSDVYGSIQELEEAKVNVRKTYLKPMWLMMTRVRADRLMTWAASLMTRISNVLDTVEVEDEASTQLLDAVSCLTDTEKLLQTVLSSQDDEHARIEFKNAEERLQECIQLIKMAGGLPAEEIKKPTQSSSASSAPYVNRRLKSRLNENYQR